MFVVDEITVPWCDFIATLATLDVIPQVPLNDEIYFLQRFQRLYMR